MYSNVVFFDYFVGFFWTNVMCKLYLVTCETEFVLCFLRRKWKSVYRLLQRHRCRRGTCSCRLQYADMELLSLLLQFFEVSASSADCARLIAIYGSRAQLSVISSSSSILVTLCSGPFWFRRYSRVTLTCYSFDVLDLILFWYFRSLSHFFVWRGGGITG